MNDTIACKLCGGTDHEVIRDTLRYDIRRQVLRCRQCEFVFLEPKAESAPDFYAGKTYRQTYGPNLEKTADSREIFETHYPFQYQIIDRLKDILRPDMRVLDVGCSTGHFLAALKGKVAVRVGMEFNQEEAAFIRSKLDFPVYTEPIETAPIAESPFDLITALQVVEHVEDPVGFLRNLAWQLAPDGYLYIELPNLHDILLGYYHVAGYLLSND